MNSDLEKRVDRLEKLHLYGGVVVISLLIIAYIKFKKIK